MYQSLKRTVLKTETSLCPFLNAKIALKHVEGKSTENFELVLFDRG
jgi:hypothetical protein